jgi:hypothetical protein
VSAVYCALVHHPVVDRQGEEVTTSVTNLDVLGQPIAESTDGLCLAIGSETDDTPIAG